MRVLPCPQCSFSNIEMHSTLELAPVVGADEIMLYALECPSSCAARFFGVVKEIHLPQDSMDAFAFRVKDDTSWANLLSQFKICSTPQNKNCTCIAHARFRAAIEQKTYEVPGVELSNNPVALAWKNKEDFPHLKDDDVVPPYWP